MIRAKMQSFKMSRRFVLSSLLLTGLLGGAAFKAVAAAGSFSFTGSLNTARYGHTAMLLPNGEVLVAGGLDINGNPPATNPLASAELYNPATGKWTVTGSMSEARAAFTATLLPSGEVLVAGGSGNNGPCFSSAELYNASTGQWTPTGSMTQPRCSHSATLLPTGEVLVAGGVETLAVTPDTPPTQATAELYNPSTGTWHTTGSLNTSRGGQGAVLENGQVLVIGGYHNSSTAFFAGLASAELYDPSQGSWSVTASMQLALSAATPVLLPNSDVLIANDAQFYNPATATWVNTGALPKVAGPPGTASPLQNGNVLGSGTTCNYSGCGHVPTSACFLYTTSTNSWSIAGSMNHPRIRHTSTLLPSGKVLVVGGYSRTLGGPITILSSAELYTP
jgi:hypothetical protein